MGREAGESGKGLLGGSSEQMQDLNKADIIYCLLCFTVLFEMHYLISPPIQSRVYYHTAYILRHTLFTTGMSYNQCEMRHCQS